MLTSEESWLNEGAEWDFSVGQGGCCCCIFKSLKCSCSSAFCCAPLAVWVMDDKMAVRAMSIWKNELVAHWARNIITIHSGKAKLAEVHFDRKQFLTWLGSGATLGSVCDVHLQEQVVGSRGTKQNHHRAGHQAALACARRSSRLVFLTIGKQALSKWAGGALSGQTCATRLSSLTLRRHPWCPSVAKMCPVGNLHFGHRAPPQPGTASGHLVVS